MEKLNHLFDNIPLPYDYVIFPSPNEPHAPKIPGMFYYVNRAITGITRRAFIHGGLTQSATFNRWNASWGRQYEAPQYNKCLSWQKINHFAGAFLMGRKDDFHQRMEELKERDPEIATFYPESYLLPKNNEEFREVFYQRTTWIYKPYASARGNGIELIKSIDAKDIPIKRGIYQVYIEKPLLITKRKFDLRLYVMVTSVNPLIIYMHENGMARFATHEYVEDASISDLQMHLTNFSLNKDDDSFIMSSGKEIIQNSKWSIQFFLDYLEKQGIDVKQLMKKIEKVVIASFIAGMTTVREHHFNCIKHRHTSYELYGVDVILDQDLNPYIMEINISPSMDTTGSKLDREIKFPLLIDTLNKARIIKCNSKSKDPCPSIASLDILWRKSMSEERVKDVVNNKVDPWENPVFADFTFIRDFLEENKIPTKYRRVYPKRKTMSMFSKCFSRKLYSDIVFQKWIEMSMEKRYEVIEKSFATYQNTMDQLIRPEKNEKPFVVNLIENAEIQQKETCL
ncbi:Tubulin-tyrosine ligase family protein [Tritrichomonas foetus]|uniref:Tubulin--tyrosine ligase-like protein 5 n=1 Tax=Tritrichomonas foetus TaxID=1144522 RepID=A0A1J4L2P2_9EUKA|nr:Tubulin-tyrosine ligase family protein [Tritrichomonas foetus]|eukprot:OHT16236.1 Tubulin-tyrosine ligase family protein [Tritrichomonas foetus]